MSANLSALSFGIAWCLAWGKQRTPQVDISILQAMRQALKNGDPVPEEVKLYLDLIQYLNTFPYPQSGDDLTALVTKYPQLWQAKIGLVYGGATKIKQYVFEAPKLPDIRGASALLDRINLVDLPAFFHGETSDRFEQCQRFPGYCRQVREDWLDRAANFPALSTALIPELIIYSTGGNLLALCPAAYVDDLANAIEKRYTTETLTANACAVGRTFRPLELRLGLLADPIGQTPWLDWYQKQQQHPLVAAYYDKQDGSTAERFAARKSFNELTTQLAIDFNRRRGGHDGLEATRPSRRYPPMFETHPYLRRDSTDRRLAAGQAQDLPDAPYFSEATARKRLMGQIAKREDQSDHWFRQIGWDWHPGEVESWVRRFEQFLEMHSHLRQTYNPESISLQEARSLREIGNVSNGFVAYLYADGNNMGGYLQTLKTAEDYQRFSEIVSKATEQSVYYALAQHLQPQRLHDINDAETQGRDGQWIHPFEILTIGGDDVMLVVPAHQALAIAKSLSEAFERLLLEADPSFGMRPQTAPSTPGAIHRYCPESAPIAQCQLSMSVGVLITAEDTPIYYAENLTSQLLKSAKKKAKQLKTEAHYAGGTVDFLVMKSVTMLSSEISEFREAGLVLGHKPKLKLFGAPYTLHEIDGLLKTGQALKAAGFPRSQLYQIRSLLERGKHTAILNYRYFRVRLSADKQALLQDAFEQAWCQPKDADNRGNLAPWMSRPDKTGTTYETIWRELVDLYPFIEAQDPQRALATPPSTGV
ncbi:type III-B CRISPR-associated protein Cas10/Cmr2 [Synechococcales cyanobacterium C]|uniref:Type III-B CRISPR-associated protein Cas10/Cmr2 n=1 Tax=Petrachloros mirabilis ULC683 TaxID=2781853 RepID=A0A8K2A927_9CYAN|nr:type III-B CRISPR-associated protein Cas10/Cmr2 [Petrachloros mirabilis]NCJ08676.1 type III-B CRISPR-associated protein Cas10/Cmr2 [Petrachloros mirabilis ULC683]